VTISCKRPIKQKLPEGGGGGGGGEGVPPKKVSHHLNTAAQFYKRRMCTIFANSNSRTEKCYCLKMKSTKAQNGSFVKLYSGARETVSDPKSCVRFKKKAFCFFGFFFYPKGLFTLVKLAETEKETET